MPSVTLDLGSIGLVSTSPDLHLQLLSSAKCVSSNESYSVEGLNHAILDQYCKTRPWFQLSSSFRFTIVICSDWNLPPRAWEALQQSIPTAIERAEIWQQLNLLPAEVATCGAEDETSFQLSLRLIHGPNESSQKTRIPHKLGTNVPFSHVRPPSGVLSVTMEEVYLEMKLSVDVGTPIADLTPEFSQGSHSDGSLAVSSQQNGSQLGLELPGSQISIAPANSWRSSQGHDHGKTIHNLQKLIDSGLRTALSANPRNLHTGIRTTSQVAFKRLDQIAAPLWAPGFLSIISQKANFLPTISHSLINCAQRSRSNDSSFKFKVAELERRACKSPKNPSASCNEKGPGISTEIWQMLHRNTAMMTTGKKLKPLFPKTNETARSLTSFSSSQLMLSEEGNDSSEFMHIMEDPLTTHKEMTLSKRVDEADEFMDFGMDEAQDDAGWQNWSNVDASDRLLWAQHDAEMSRWEEDLEIGELIRGAVAHQPMEPLRSGVLDEAEVEDIWDDVLNEDYVDLLWPV